LGDDFAFQHIKCLNDACRYQALIDVSSYPADIEVPSFHWRAKCRKCRCQSKTDEAAIRLKPFKEFDPAYLQFFGVRSLQREL